MSPETLQETADSQPGPLGNNARGAADAPSSCQLGWRAWLARTAAVTFLVGGGIVSYLLFAGL